MSYVDVEDRQELVRRLRGGTHADLYAQSDSDDISGSGTRWKAYRKEKKIRAETDARRDERLKKEWRKYIGKTTRTPKEGTPARKSLDAWIRRNIEEKWRDMGLSLEDRLSRFAVLDIDKFLHDATPEGKAHNAVKRAIQALKTKRHNDIESAEAYAKRRQETFDRYAADAIEAHEKAKLARANAVAAAEGDEPAKIVSTLKSKATRAEKKFEELKAKAIKQQERNAKEDIEEAELAERLEDHYNDELANLLVLKNQKLPEIDPAWAKW